MSQFLSLASDRELRLHEDIQSRACAGCGSIFVPGMNSTVKIVAAETKRQKERRNAVERRKSKAEKKKAITPNEQEKGHSQGLGIATNKASVDTTLTDNINTATSAMSSSQPRKAAISSKKTIQIIQYTEQVQKLNQAQRGLGTNRVDKAEARSDQLLNHVVYHCKRCERETEIPGTKKGYLDGRIKPSKTISRKRKQKRQTPSQSAVTPTPSQSSSLLPSKDTNPPSPTTVAGQKRPRPGIVASMPASPVGGLSRASSAASSAATSPTSSPRISTLNEKSSSRKKKKTNLASLLASQKAEKGSPPDQGGGGDSVLANFLMGL
ncbi:hypothetical protein BG006_009759 [Podila minutissima]|uniref:Uncharacterized protein n=1 Tax=Podila minutissima TaxID=64525 RepID=A0A9P5SE50_9FUNG|nr:hypothetical protein BG006_009759 [Podila minutissima]